MCGKPFILFRSAVIRKNQIIFEECKNQVCHTTLNIWRFSKSKSFSASTFGRTTKDSTCPKFQKKIKKSAWISAPRSFHFFKEPGFWEVVSLPLWWTSIIRKEKINEKTQKFMSRFTLTLKRFLDIKIYSKKSFKIQISTIN